jgi:GNAT superfamily N-acetyltransferase
MPSIKLALTTANISRCFPVIHQLRPALREEEFVARIRTQQSEGYHLAFLEHEGNIVSVAGFRLFTLLWSGRTLYVDDLITDAGHRSQGHGEAMLKWLIAHARHHECATFSLDSGTHRPQAHAFYFRNGLRITDFHFELPLK